MNYGLWGKYNPWLYGKAAKTRLYAKAAKPFAFAKAAKPLAYATKAVKSPWIWGI